MKDETSNTSFRREIASVINRWSRENDSDTPDFILAEYLESCLEAFDRAVRATTEHQRGIRGDAP